MNQKIAKVCALILLVFNQAAAQNKISGTVYDQETKEALIGASVIISGTKNGATTDVDGQFTLDFMGNFPIRISLSYIGYEGQEIVVSTSRPVEIFLVAQSSSLSEVTVTARRKNEDLQKTPIPIAVLGNRIFHFL